MRVLSLAAQGKLPNSLPTDEVTVHFRVTVPRVSSRTYTFDATTDRFGAFYRTVRFNLGKPAYGYTIKATAVGERGDRATLSTWASGQPQ